jgi:putative membrane protein
MKLGAIGFWIVGLAVAVALLAIEGFQSVAAALAVAGWGLVWISGIHVCVLVADTIAWRWLIIPQNPVSLIPLLWVRWIGESVNHLLPVASVGGELLRAWLAHRALGVRGSVAAASTVVDMTLAVVTQILFTLLGLGVLVSRGAQSQLIDTVVIGCALLAAAVVAFIVVQRAGLFGFSSRLVETVASRAGWTSVVDDGTRLDDAILQTYAGAGPVTASTVWRMLAWFIGAVEIWAGAMLLGYPIDFAEALMLESLVLAIRSAAFVVPGGYGIQEGTFVILGALIGMPADVALALSLVKRIRELVIGLPGLLAWQVSALHRAWARSSSSLNAPA